MKLNIKVKKLPQDCFTKHPVPHYWKGGLPSYRNHRTITKKDITKLCYAKALAKDYPFIYMISQRFNKQEQKELHAFWFAYKINPNIEIELLP